MLQKVERKVENGYTVLDWPNGKPLVQGEEVTAYFELGQSGQKFKGTPNQIGKYPRVFVEPNESVKIKLDFPESAPKTPVAIWQEDGGKVEADGELTNSAKLEVSESRTVDFSFTPTDNEGVHRVVFHTPGGQMRILDLWVGQDNIYRTKKL